MINKRGQSTIITLCIIFVLIVAVLIGFMKFKLPPEFYSSFAGALAALLFSSLVTFYIWQKANKQSIKTKAQIVQTLLSEVELNLGNIAGFIRGCKEGTYFQPYTAAVMQKNLFWPRFLTDYPHPSFELTQKFDQLYGTFWLMEFYSKEMQMSLPENLRFYPVTSAPLPLPDQELIRRTAQIHQSKWKMGVKSAIDYYDDVLGELTAAFEKYTFRKQMYFEQNEIYEKLKRFCTEM